MLGYLLSSRMPDDLGVNAQGQLKPVPSSPNCVCSQANPEDKTHYMPPWPYQNLSDARDQIVACIDEFGSTKIISKSDNYIHAVFLAGWMKYQDDVEFCFDEEQQIIHFRSASRIGYRDFGANRRRMKRLKQMYYNKKTTQ